MNTSRGRRCTGHAVAPRKLGDRFNLGRRPAVFAEARRRPSGEDERDPEADAVPGLTRDRNSRSEGRRSMCSAIHITSRTWLRPSSTREPSDPPLRVVLDVSPGAEARGRHTVGSTTKPPPTTTAQKHQQTAPSARRAGPAAHRARCPEATIALGCLAMPTCYACRTGRNPD